MYFTIETSVTVSCGTIGISLYLDTTSQKTTIFHGSIEIHWFQFANRSSKKGAFLRHPFCSPRHRWLCNCSCFSNLKIWIRSLWVHEPLSWKQINHRALWIKHHIKFSSDHGKSWIACFMKKPAVGPLGQNSTNPTPLREHCPWHSDNLLLIHDTLHYNM